jgi:hypothetical protein
MSECGNAISIHPRHALPNKIDRMHGGVNEKGFISSDILLHRLYRAPVGSNWVGNPSTIGHHGQRIEASSPHSMGTTKRGRDSWYDICLYELCLVGYYNPDEPTGRIGA